MRKSAFLLQPLGEQRIMGNRESCRGDEARVKPAGSYSMILWILFILVGGILGGIIGDIVTANVQIGSVIPMLSQHHEILTIQQINLNLYVMEIQFGIHFAPNLFSLLGMILAAVIFRRMS